MPCQVGRSQITVAVQRAGRQWNGLLSCSARWTTYVTDMAVAFYGTQYLCGHHPAIALC